MNTKESCDLFKIKITEISETLADIAQKDPNNKGFILITINKYEKEEKTEEENDSSGKLGVALAGNFKNLVEALYEFSRTQPADRIFDRVLEMIQMEEDPA